jgi:hypothetical protein
MLHKSVAYTRGGIKNKKKIRKNKCVLALRIRFLVNYYGKVSEARRERRG